MTQGRAPTRALTDSRALPALLVILQVLPLKLCTYDPAELALATSAGEGRGKRRLCIELHHTLAKGRAASIAVGMLGAQSALSALHRRLMDKRLAWFVCQKESRVDEQTEGNVKE